MLRHEQAVTCLDLRLQSTVHNSSSGKSGAMDLAIQALGKVLNEVNETLTSIKESHDWFILIVMVDFERNSSNGHSRYPIPDGSYQLERV